MSAVLISGGGTGGHLAIAKAMMLECQKRGIKCIYIGSTAGQDRLWFEKEEGFEQKYFLPTLGVVNQKGLGRFKSLFFQFKAIARAIKILKAHKPIAVFSVGGYSSAPASLASIILKIPLFIHEQNAVRGTLNRLLAPFARKIYGSFGAMEKNFYPTSYPVRDEFFEFARLREEIKCVMFLGGSQGAVAINDFAIQIAPILKQKQIKIIHQSGEKDFERVQKAYQELEIQAEVFAFAPNMAQRMREADLCFARAGASSVWEMCANALPCVYIPYPYAAGNHQFFNASFFTQENLGILCEQKDLTKEVLNQALSFDIATSSRLLQNKIQSGGAREILDSLLSSL